MNARRFGPNETLDNVLCEAIDVWLAARSDTTGMQILAALERVRHVVTEGMLGRGPGDQARTEHRAKQEGGDGQ